MSVPVLQDQLLGRQVPSPSTNAWERSEAGDVQAAGNTVPFFSVMA